MVTINDRMYSLMLTCYGNGMSPSRFPYYAYVFQRACLETGYVFKLRTNGLSCVTLDGYVGEAISLGIIQRESQWDKFELTPQGVITYEDIALTADHWDKLQYSKSVLDSLDNSELEFLCLADKLVQDMVASGGSTALIEGADSIRNILQNLSSEYSKENFNSVLKFFREVQEL